MSLQSAFVEHIANGVPIDRAAKLAGLSRSYARRLWAEIVSSMGEQGK